MRVRGFPRRAMFVEVGSSGFIAIPHDPAFLPIRQAVEQALAERDIQPLPDVLSADQIARSAFVIADVTLPSPTVFYQLGLADGLRKPALLIAQNNDALPPELSSRHKVLIYRLDEGPKLQRFISYWIRDTLEIAQRSLRPAAVS